MLCFLQSIHDLLLRCLLYNDDVYGFIMPSINTLASSYNAPIDTIATDTVKQGPYDQQLAG